MAHKRQDLYFMHGNDSDLGAAIGDSGENRIGGHLRKAQAGAGPPAQASARSHKGDSMTSYFVCDDMLDACCLLERSGVLKHPNFIPGQ